MKWQIPNIKQVFAPIKNNFFLKRHFPSESTLSVLRQVYPTIDWSRVDFYEGLPWFTPSVAPYVSAQALPQFYSFNKFRIYLSKYDESRAQCLSDIVHEAFHVLQAMSFGKGYGIGFFRIWMVYYIATFFKHGYRQNPFEIPAYDQEFRFLKYCEKHGLHGIIPKVTPEALQKVAQEPALVFNTITFKYEESPLLLIVSFFLCLFIAFIKPFIDILIFIIRIFIPARETENKIK